MGFITGKFPTSTHSTSSTITSWVGLNWAPTCKTPVSAFPCLFFYSSTYTPNPPKRFPELWLKITNHLPAFCGAQLSHFLTTDITVARDPLNRKLGLAVVNAVEREVISMLVRAMQRDLKLCSRGSFVKTWPPSHSCVHYHIYLAIISIIWYQFLTNFVFSCLCTKSEISGSIAKEKQSGDWGGGLKSSKIWPIFYQIWCYYDVIMIIKITIWKGRMKNWGEKKLEYFILMKSFLTKILYSIAPCVGWS